VTIAGLTISNGDSPGGGGGIQNDHGTVTVRECVLFGNRSSLEHYTYGGGIYNWGGRMTIEQSTIAGNVSKFGGGVASTRTGFGTAVLVIRNSTISGNTAEGGSGGGVYNAAAGSDSIAQMFLFNCTLSGNSATATGFFGGAGGALYNEASNLARAEVELGDCTIAHNNAPSTGGIYNQNLNATARVTLQNTLLQTSPTGSNFTNSNGSIESLGNNLSSDGAGDASNTGTVPGGFLNKPSDRRNTDAMLGPLQDNGGPTFTHALLTGSPAINTGNNDGAADDQRGYLRVGLNDIGAFEFGGVQLRIINIARADSDIVVTFQAAGGLGYSLQRKLNLRGAAWETVNDGTAPSDGPAQITHVGGASTGKAFYRVVRPEA
ncbi:MAG TPA: choice-of-anchor Q domain-containing protein, partial [Chthoniobacterales bacterium]|nr:choice-of-anchor Q domain-containing protein [Chthoniobacterales bacterium]